MNSVGVSKEKLTLSELNSSSDVNIGAQMHSWVADLFPICRSITGPGVRSTLQYIQRLIPELTIYSVSSGTKAFDWTVPDEWTIRDAYIADSAGNRIVDFKTCNLHVVGYSVPINSWVSLEELDKHLHSLPAQPDAIPYVTSYYLRYWGFCISHTQRQSLRPGLYHCVIDSDLRAGCLNYGELIIRGSSPQEVLLSTYICHPSLANNELSGPVVATALARWLGSLHARQYTYRILFIPETIGSIVYLSRHLDYLKSHVVAGFNISCVGDQGGYSYIPSRNGCTISDQVALHTLRYLDPKFVRHTWLSRGSDERQYCAPGVDLPIATIMRTRFGDYPEYHTSLDDLSVVTPTGLEGGFMALKLAVGIIEQNCYPMATMLCEPQLSKHGLRTTLGGGTRSWLGDDAGLLSNLLTFSDGTISLLEIAELIGVTFWELLPFVNTLQGRGLLSCSRETVDSSFVLRISDPK